MPLISKAFGDIITFTRASTGSYFNSAGVLQSAAINAPRLDYNPSTLAAQGLLIEEQRANLVLQSAALSTQNVTVTAVAHTLSFYGTGTIVLSGATTNTLVGTGAFPTRSTLTFTPTAGTLTLTVTGTVQYGQLEIGSFATSYIPTTTVAVTRSADVASVNTLSPWYNATEGTLYVQAMVPNAVGASDINTAVMLSDGTTNKLIAIRPRFTNQIQGVVVDSGATQANFTPTSFVANATFKSALSYGVNDFKYAVNGVSSADDTSGTVPTVTQLNLGVNGLSFQPLNGYLRRVSYYPRKFSSAELQTITA